MLSGGALSALLQTVRPRHISSSRCQEIRVALRAETVVFFKHGCIERRSTAERPARLRNGGARRDRTDDLKLAKLPLSQLSYGPLIKLCLAARGTSRSSRVHRKKWWAWEDLNFRPHAYQARALTN